MLLMNLPLAGVAKLIVMLCVIACYFVIIYICYLLRHFYPANELANDSIDLRFRATFATVTNLITSSKIIEKMFRIKR
jgi:hypothetical protein